MRISRLFTEHPATVGESYTQHMRSALSFAIPLLGAALACSVHALLPFLFTSTGSRTVIRLHERMVVCRHRNPAAPDAASRASAPGTESRQTA